MQDECERVRKSFDLTELERKRKQAEEWKWKKDTVLVIGHHALDAAQPQLKIRTLLVHNAVHTLDTLLSYVDCHAKDAKEDDALKQRLAVLIRRGVVADVMAVIGAVVRCAFVRPTASDTAQRERNQAAAHAVDPILHAALLLKAVFHKVDVARELMTSLPDFDLVFDLIAHSERIWQQAGATTATGVLGIAVSALSAIGLVSSSTASSKAEDCSSKDDWAVAVPDHLCVAALLGPAFVPLKPQTTTDSVLEVHIDEHLCDRLALYPRLSQFQTALVSLLRQLDAELKAKFKTFESWPEQLTPPVLLLYRIFDVLKLFASRRELIAPLIEQGLFSVLADLTLQKSALMAYSAAMLLDRLAALHIALVDAAFRSNDQRRKLHVIFPVAAYNLADGMWIFFVV